MTKEIRTRNLGAESKYAFFINVLLLASISVILWLLLPPCTKVGTRNMLFMNFLFTGIVSFFMIALEKYTISVSGLYEKIVTNVLSVFYASVIMMAMNGVFFYSKIRLLADIYLMLTSVFLLMLNDWIFERVVKNTKIYRNPRLLIINSEERTFVRMKRIKYGTLGAYDSWYEDTSKLVAMEFKDFVDTKFAEFDAICILDGLDAEKYSIAMKSAKKHNKDLYIVPNMVDVGMHNATMIRFDDVLTVHVPADYISGVEHFIKRAMDIVFACVTLLVMAIPMGIIALGIKLTSSGPVFYKQERMTIKMKKFMMYKFRTMVPDAEKLTGPKFAEKDDPRITKIGKFLRACRLDELPQLINILLGDMSVVGPRPERPVFINQFEKEIENYDYRFAVKAGLTSLSHVYGRYSTYIHDRTYYDLYYIANYSFFLDLKIILLTTKTIFLKSSAEGEDSFKDKTTTYEVSEKKLGI